MTTKPIPPSLRALLLASVTALLAASPGIAAAGDCSPAARAFVDSLDESQAGRARAPFDDELRRDWSYRTGSKDRDIGLAIGDMSGEQRVLAHRLLACGLSDQGYQKIAAIMRLDDYVMAHIGETVFASLPGPYEIGHEFYWLLILGDPGGDQGNLEPWGLQFEGHHIGVNLTFAGDELAATPLFLGVEPAVVPRGPLAGWRNLAVEVDAAVALAGSLDDTQRATAVLDDVVPRGIFTGPGNGDVLKDYEGLPASSMTVAQRALLWQLMNAYLGNLESATADSLIERINADGQDGLYFAWMGPTVPDSAFYYRVHGASILIEFDHAQNLRSRKRSPDPNHIHTIMRDPRNDYGVDLLRRHYAESPHHQGQDPEAR